MVTSIALGLRFFIALFGRFQKKVVNALVIEWLQM